MIYRCSSRSDFDAFATLDGAVYHQRGGYEIANDSGDIFTPVNRSYRQLEIERVSQNIQSQLSRDNYTNHDRVINDSVGDELQLRRDERLIEVFGKQIFFLQSNQDNVWQEFSTQPIINSEMSKESSLLVAQLGERLEAFGSDIRLGVYGSHQVGLNRSDSDLDLIAWAPSDLRQDVIEMMQASFKAMGYESVLNIEHTLGKYAARYAARTGLSYDTGYYLARQRLRWISPEGVSTSLQCLHTDYNHTRAAEVVDKGLQVVYHSQDVVLDNVEIFGQAEAYNFPRIWSVLVDDEPIDVISFDWAHQGMGVEVSEPHQMSAKKVTTSLGETTLVLARQSDFLLPARLVK